MERGYPIEPKVDDGVITQFYSSDHNFSISFTVQGVQGVYKFEGQLASYYRTEETYCLGKSFKNISILVIV